MRLPDKVKTALEETRILILGAQILLGFQFSGAFSEGYDRLPGHSRYLDGLALGFMVCAVGLLIALGPYHLIVERGEDSGEFHRFATVIAGGAALRAGAGRRSVPRRRAGLPRCRRDIGGCDCDGFAARALVWLSRS